MTDRVIPARCSTCKLDFPTPALLEDHLRANGGGELHATPVMGYWGTHAH